MYINNYISVINVYAAIIGLFTSVMCVSIGLKHLQNTQTLLYVKFKPFSDKYNRVYMVHGKAYTVDRVTRIDYNMATKSKVSILSSVCRQQYEDVAAPSWLDTKIFFSII